MPLNCSQPQSNCSTSSIQISNTTSENHFEVESSSRFHPIDTSDSFATNSRNHKNHGGNDELRKM